MAASNDGADEKEEKEESTLKFYASKNSTAAQRVWTVLEYFGVKYEFINCTLQESLKEDYFKEAYSKALGKQEDSTGKVPIIYHNGKYIAESTIIIRYLDAIFGSDKNINSLFPDDVFDKICVESISEWFLKKWVPLHFGLLFESDSTKYKEKGENFKKMLKLFCKRLNEMSDNGLFLKDDTKLCYLEVLCIPYLDRLIILEKLCNLPIITEWIENDEELERLKSFYYALKQIKAIKICSMIQDDTLDFYVDYYNKIRAKWKKTLTEKMNGIPIDMILYRF